VSITIETTTGHKAEVTIHQAVDGVVVVKASTQLRGLRSPALVLARVEGDDAAARAVAWVDNVKAAIEAMP
jgi:hypothetical protein